MKSFADRTGSALNTGATIHLSLAQRDGAATVIDNLEPRKGDYSA
jgi:hypothetical protein